MRSRIALCRQLFRGARLPIAVAFAVACALIGALPQASAKPGPSAGKRCSGLFVVGSYDSHGRVYNLTCEEARSYSRHMPTGWSGALRNDGSAEHALIYRSRDANRVMRAIKPGGASADPDILGRRPLIIISVPPVS